MKGIEGLPTKEEVLGATKANIHEWDPLSIKQYEGNQSDESFSFSLHPSSFFQLGDFSLMLELEPCILLESSLTLDL